MDSPKERLCVKPRLLDLFCGAGGAGMGYHLAGFEVVGVDIEPQPKYPFEFHQADALTFPLEGFDAIHASPPCQAYSVTKHLHPDKIHPDLLEPTRQRLIASGLPYVIENVPGAPMNAIQLCGSSFGLGVEAYDGWRELRRHRYFESSVYMLAPHCQHQDATIGIYGDHARDRRRKNGSRGLDFPDKDKRHLGQTAMGMPWCDDWRGLSQAIPPAYTEWIGRRLLAAMESAA